MNLEGEEKSLQPSQDLQIRSTKLVYAYEKQGNQTTQPRKGDVGGMMGGESTSLNEVRCAL
jgi:hypothetical protein